MRRVGDGTSELEAAIMDMAFRRMREGFEGECYDFLP
jgi:hypothetical protein